MTLYWAVAVRAFRRAATYRGAYLAGIITNAFFGALICFVYLALYADGGRVAGLSAQDAISYTWTTQSLISIGGAWIVSTGIAQSIRTGDVITDLTRPWSFYLYWLSRSFGERAFNLLFRGAFTYLIGVLYFAARLPTPADLLAFLPTIVLAMLISFAFSFLVNLTAFWLLDNSGVVLLSNLMLTFLSGFILPVAYFPPALQALVRALPFESITGLPAQIFLGQLAPDQIARALATQAAWAVAMTALALAAQAAAMRKVVVQGG
jgi:ABC-2 type transport system permease protein